MKPHKRNLFLLGFGVVAILVVISVTSWPPSFNREEASGAIGVVQKHRQPQITDQDVVLGDEQTRAEASVLYTDYFADAAKLQNVSADLGIAMANRDSALQAKAVEALESHKNELQARYQARASETLAAFEQMAARADLSAKEAATLQAQTQELGARLQMKEQLAAAEMDTMNARFQAMADVLQARLAARSEMNARAELAAVANELQGRSQLASRSFVGAASRLEAASRNFELGRKAGGEQQDYLGAAQRVEHLEAMSALAAQMQEARSQLSAASQLGAAAMASRLASVSQDLAGHAASLEARASENLQARLNSHAEMAAKFQGMRDSLEAMQKWVGSRSNDLEAKALESFNRSVNAFSTELQARSTEFNARLSANVQNELAAVGQYLEAQANLQARFNAASRMGAKAVEAKSLEAKSLEAKALESSALAVKALNAKFAANRDNLASHLQALSQALDAKSALGARLNAREELAAQAQTLEARSELQAKAN